MKVLLLCLCALGTVAADGLEDGELVLYLQHSFDMGASWTDRGTVSVHSTRSGSATVDQSPLEQEQKGQLAKLCSEGGLYLVRATPSSQAGQFRSYSSACGFLEAQLMDTLTIQLDWRGKLSAIAHGLQTPYSARGGLGGGLARGETAREDGSVMKTKVLTQHMENGPVPDTAAFIQRMEENKRKEEKGEVKDNRSFLAKYWMYIVPVVLFMAVNGAASPQQ